MKKKILFMLLLLFLTSGCDVTYNLSFYDNNFNENISFYINNTKDNIETIEILKNTEQQVYYVDEDIGKLNYKKNYIEENNKIKFSYNFDYGLDFSFSRPLKECFNTYSFIDEKNYYIIQTGDEFNCFVYDYMFIDNIKIIFETDKKVLEHNADLIDGNKYIWNFNSKDSLNKNITLKIDKNVKNNSFNNILNNLKNGSWFLVIMLGIFGILILFIIFIIYRINKKNNKI